MHRLIDMHCAPKRFYCKPNEYLKRPVNGWVQWVPQYDVNKCPFQTDSPDTFAYRFVSGALKAFYCSVSDNVPATHSVSREGTTNTRTHTHTYTYVWMRVAVLLNPHCNFARLCFPSTPWSRWTPTQGALRAVPPYYPPHPAGTLGHLSRGQRLKLPARRCAV